MLQYQKEDLNSELAYNSFRDEVMHKTILVQNLVFEFQKLNNEQNASKSTIQCIKFSRRVIDEVQGILQGIKIYLGQLKLDFLYDLLVNIFRILLGSVNSISSKFIQTLQSKKLPTQYHEEIIKKPERIPNETSTKPKHNSQFKEMQYFDFVIKNLQEEEERLNERRREMEKQLMQEARSINSITPSQAINQLETLDKDLQRIISNSQKISGENVLFRYQELSKRILSLKKPEEINNQFCNKISSSVKEKFISTMQRIIRQLYIEIKNKQKQQILLQILGSKPTLKQCAIQTETDGKSRQVEQLNKEKKNFISQIQSLKKSNSLLQNEFEKIIEKYKLSKEIIRSLERRNEDLDQLLKRKINEINVERSQHQKKYEQLVNFYQKKSEKTERFSKTDSFMQLIEQPIKQNDSSEQHQNTNIGQESLRTSKYKPLRDRTNNSFFYDKEAQVQKKQNFVLRSCLQKVLNKLDSSLLITSSEIDKELKAGNMTQKVDEIILSLQSKLMIRIQSNAEKETAQAIQKQNAIQKSKECTNLMNVRQWGTQTEHHVTYNQTQLLLDRQDNNTQMGQDQTKKSKLQALKIQFLQKLKRKKEQSHSTKYRIKYKNNGSPSHLDNINQTMENRCSDEIGDQPEMTSISKSKHSLIRKDISFEQFKIAKNDKKLLPDKKFIHRGKKNEATRTEHSRQKNAVQQRFSNKPMISLQSYEVLKQIRPIVQMIEIKNDAKDHFFNHFIRTLMEEFERMKGRPFMENILAKQLNKITAKQNKSDMKLNKSIKNVEATPSK